MLPLCLLLFGSLLLLLGRHDTTKVPQISCRFNAVEVVIAYVVVQEQRGASDCGLYALAFITSICNGIDLVSLSYQQAATF